LVFILLPRLACFIISMTILRRLLTEKIRNSPLPWAGS
jgi:hypothetical protein